MFLKESLKVIITFRDFIVRNPGKKHSIENFALYRMLFSRVSDDKNTQSYDHLKTLLKHSRFPFKKFHVLYICVQRDTHRQRERGKGIEY